MHSPANIASVTAQSQNRRVWQSRRWHLVGVSRSLRQGDTPKNATGLYELDRFLAVVTLNICDYDPRALAGKDPSACPPEPSACSRN